MDFPVFCCGCFPAYCPDLGGQYKGGLQSAARARRNGRHAHCDNSLISLTRVCAMSIFSKSSFAVLVMGIAMAGSAIAQSDSGAAKSPAAAQPSATDSALLTIFLRHDQSKTLGEINQELQRNGYFEKFPPPGVEVVSWYVMMGIGQVVTLRVPADKLREVNVALENTAWGAFRTEFYPTYDYKLLAQKQREAMASPKP
jgi:hypothetical protein